MAFQRAGFLVRLDLHDKGDLLVVRRHKSGQVHCDGLSAITGRSSVFYIILFLHGSSVGMKSSDDPCKSPLDDPDHFRFRSSAVSVIASALIKTAPDDLNLYGVAVNGSACAALGNEQVSLKSFYSDKAESPGIAVEFTRKMLFFSIFTHILLILFMSKYCTERRSFAYKNTPAAIRRSVQ